MKINLSKFILIGMLIASQFCSKLPSLPTCKDKNLEICRSEAKIFTGRLLFYDEALSVNNKVSCSTCHIQKLAFSDGVNLTKLGVSGHRLKRHTPALFNLQQINNGLFWDGGAKNLRSLVFAPITNKDEMGLSIAELLNKVEARGYGKLFEKAFSNGEVSMANIALSLESFLFTIVSENSKYDKVMRGETKFSESEDRGYQIFKSNCSNCHTEPDFSDHNFYNIGLDLIIDKNLDLDPELMNIGRERITFLESDRGKFKTPSLRNIELTAPYMHNGRFNNLAEVIDHFDSGVKVTRWTDIRLLKNKISLDENEKKYLLIFLKTLTDERIIYDNRFSDPFQ